jgi:hypothetical protein
VVVARGLLVSLSVRRSLPRRARTTPTLLNPEIGRALSMMTNRKNYEAILRSGHRSCSWAKVEHGVKPQCLQLPA